MILLTMYSLIHAMETFLIQLFGTPAKHMHLLSYHSLLLREYISCFEALIIRLTLYLITASSSSEYICIQTFVSHFTLCSFGGNLFIH